MRLVSWNIGQRRRRTDAQVDAISACCPDLVALQEVNPRELDNLYTGLHSIKLPYILDSFDPNSSRRSYFNLIASRWPLLVGVPGFDIDIPFPESVLSVTVNSPYGSIALHTVHIPPGSSHGWIKIETFEGLYHGLANVSKHPRILCGDFNSPMDELQDGTVRTWGQSPRTGKIRPGKTRWDDGERNVIEGLADYDLPDVFRLINGYTFEAHSWFLKRGKKVIGRRFDHIFASNILNPIWCRYRHDVLQMKLSDHAAIEAEFRPG